MSVPELGHNCTSIPGSNHSSVPRSEQVNREMGETLAILGKDLEEYLRRLSLDMRILRYVLGRPQSTQRTHAHGLKTIVAARSQYHRIDGRHACVTHAFAASK